MSFIKLLSQSVNIHAYQHTITNAVTFKCPQILIANPNYKFCLRGCIKCWVYMNRYLVISYCVKHDCMSLCLSNNSNKWCCIQMLCSCVTSCHNHCHQSFLWQLLNQLLDKPVQFAKHFLKYKSVIITYFVVCVRKTPHQFADVKAHLNGRKKPE